MIIEEFNIDQNDPFKNCKLNRRAQANVFLKLIPGFVNGGVIALNNKWGTGKTSFVKMLDAHLKKNEFTTIYFNAWENDFEDNPLSALISELKVKFPNDENSKAVVKHGAKLALNISSNIISHLLEKYIGKETIKTIAESINKSAENIFEEEIKEYSEKKKSLSDFKSSLQAFIADNTKNQPLIFFIDELDRCRPNYAVKVLECIKHLFSVPNLLFILSIDKEQLGNAINGYYGSEKFNSEEYLIRFIDLEYQLPPINVEEFVRSISKHLNLDSLLKERYSSKSEEFYRTFYDLFNSFSLRQIEKILIHNAVVLKSKAINIDLMYLFQYLVYIKFKYPGYYRNISNQKYSLKEIQEEFTKIYNSDLENNSEETDQTFALIEAEILFFYSNSFDSYQKRDHSLTKFIDGKHKPTLSSSINDPWFKDHIDSLTKSRLGRFKIIELIEVIDLIN